MKVGNSSNTDRRGPGAAKALTGYGGNAQLGGTGSNAPCLLSNLSKCEVVLWLLLATKVKLRTNTAMAIVGNINCINVYK